MSALDDMTKGIMETKATKAVKLTPVKGESGTTIAGYGVAIPAAFPFDDPVMFIQALKDARIEFAFITRGIDAMLTGFGVDLSTLPGGSVVGSQPAPDPIKAREQAADATAAVRQAVITEKLQGEAQRAAVFAAADDDGTEAPVVSDATPRSGWTCSDHPSATSTQLTSGKGRVYRQCDVEGCDEFEK